MKDETEFDDASDASAALHAAFGAEVADLDVGATPVRAVMTGGAALRVRRRVTAVSGVAALAVLPVAAVAMFGGGAGGAGGSASVQGREKLSGVLTQSATHTAPSTSPPGGMTPSERTVLPQQPLPSGHTAPHDPADQITVISDGTLAGHHWRLVRDTYLTATKQGMLTLSDVHLPMSRLGSPDTTLCTLVGLQWGTLPPGTQPDFNAGGQCGPDIAGITGPMTLGVAGVPGDPVSGPAMWALVGRVADVSKVASVSVSGDRGMTERQWLKPVAGEHDGYYVFFMPQLSAQDQQSLTITTYDPAGQVVKHTSFR